MTGVDSQTPGTLDGDDDDSLTLGTQSELMLKLMARSGSLPPTVFHYTTMSGVLGILTEKRIRATRIEFLNDFTEYRRGLQMAEHHLRALRRKHLPGPHAALVDEWIESLGVARKVRIYVACFSAVGDQLSQWRAYGRAGGYALGFATDSLLGRLADGAMRAAWLRCLYEEAEQQAYLEQMTTSLLRRFGDSGITKQKDYVVAFTGHMTAVAASFKDPAFHEEKEWRAICMGDPEPHGVKFREGKHTLVPYLEIPIEEPDGSLALASIRVGPSQYWAEAGTAAAQLAGETRAGPAELLRSAVPYRDW
jgi:hypothetical protein